ncbi:MAG: hypothetical protein HRT97_17020 [Moritella sp.]|uniref:hypothetical protein n=1 Tax=Moritella sp. TaxID=78556 RepID=UPI0025EA8DB0|nr:hypothetical protein [Moritella sp.]NQZ94029.1 hypothetical protein [Moritella sp.]
MNIEMNPISSNNTALIDNNTQNNTAILQTVKNIMITTLLCLSVIAAQRLDYFWLENSLGEQSITELLQAVLLLFSILCFYQLKRANYLPRATMLVSGFFAVLLIREFDAYFDLIFHGFWIYPALNVTFWCVVYALREGKLAEQMSTLLADKNMQTLITFIVLLFIFSRLYGMGDFWEAVMGEHYVRDVKNISEETIELLCYAFIAFYAHKVKRLYM